jgi:hypothetical protein
VQIIYFSYCCGYQYVYCVQRCLTTLWTTRWVSYKMKLGSFSTFFGGFVLLFALFFCVVLCFFVLLVFVLFLVCPKMLVPLDCPFLISTSVFYIAFTVELNFYFLPLNILFYYKLNPLIAWKSYFTIVVVWSQTLKGPPLA